METLHTGRGMNLQQNSPSDKAGIEGELTEWMYSAMSVEQFNHFYGC